MAIKTVVTWKGEFGPTAEVEQLVADEILRLEATDVTINSPDRLGGVTTRIWDSKEAALSWIAFLNLLEGAPESAVIVEE